MTETFIKELAVSLIAAKVTPENFTAVMRSAIETFDKRPKASLDKFSIKC